MASHSLQVLLVTNAWNGTSEPLTVTRLVAFVVLTGLLSMLLIETLKRLTPLRAAYQYTQTKKWLTSKAEVLDYDAMPVGEVIKAAGLGGSGVLEVRVPSSSKNQYGQRMRYERAKELLREFDAETAALQLSARLGHRGKRFGLWKSAFNLPTEQYVAQVGATVEPLSAESSFGSAVWRIFALPSEMPKESHPGQLVFSPSQLMEASQDENYMFERQVVQSLDQLQTLVSNGWQFRVRATASLASGYLGLCLVVAAGKTSVVHAAAYASFWYALASLVLGGAVAWVARDVVAIIEKLRR